MVRRFLEFVGISRSKDHAENLAGNLADNLSGNLPWGVSRDAQSGVVILEFALVVGGLLIGTLLFVDVAGALNEYLKLAQSVGEGVKIASRTPSLQPNLYADLDRDAAVIASCAGTSAPTAPCGHLLVHQRVRFLLENTEFKLDLPQTSITSELITNPLAVPTNAVRVQVRTRYRGSWLTGLPLAVGFEGPYLFD